MAGWGRDDVDGAARDVDGGAPERRVARQTADVVDLAVGDLGRAQTSDQLVALGGREHAGDDLIEFGAVIGGMIGAFLAGLLYRKTRNLYLGATGEIIGTGFIAPVVSALLVAPVFMGKSIPLLALIPSFLASTIAGTILGLLALKLLQRAEMINLEESL